MNASIGEQYVIDESGHATAVILPIESYKKILKMLREADEKVEDQVILHSPEFKRLVEKAMDDINTGKTSPWKDVWNEL